MGSQGGEFRLELVRRVLGARFIIRITVSGT